MHPSPANLCTAHFSEVSSTSLKSVQFGSVFLIFIRTLTHIETGQYKVLLKTEYMSIGTCRKMNSKSSPLGKLFNVCLRGVHKINKWHSQKIDNNIKIE